MAGRTTATAARVIDAQALDVLHAGDRCALHCHTAGGTVIVRLPLARFVASARAPRDANGRTFPDIAPPPSGKGRKQLPPARLAAYQAARHDYEVGGYTRPVAAARHGLNENSFMGWLQKQRRAEGAHGTPGRGQFGKAVTRA